MTPTNYVAYYRVSTAKQGQTGLGMQAQQQAITDFLHHHGGHLVAEYTEVGSGKQADRPEFEKAVDYAQLANAVLLVAKLDRLSRDLHFITELQKKGIRFKLADFPDIDQLTIHILAAMAQHEAQMISQRTKAALKESQTITVPPSIAKNKKQNTIMLNSTAMDILNRLSGFDTEHVFINPRTQLPYNDFKKSFKRALKEADISDTVRIHDLRHTFCSNLVSNNVSLASVQQLANHACYSTTLRYAKVSQDTLRNACQIAAIPL